MSGGAVPPCQRAACQCGVAPSPVLRSLGEGGCRKIKPPRTAQRAVPTRFRASMRKFFFGEVSPPWRGKTMGTSGRPVGLELHRTRPTIPLLLGEKAGLRAGHLVYCLVASQNVKPVKTVITGASGEPEPSCSNPMRSPAKVLAVSDFLASRQAVNAADRLSRR